MYTDQITIIDEKIAYDDYLLVINPPYKISQRIRGIKEILLRHIGHATYIKSPAHITIGAFKLKRSEKPALFKSLYTQLKKQKRFNVTLNGFKGAKNNRLLFLDVSKENLIKTHEKVQYVAHGLIAHPEDNYLNKLSLPHLTICIPKDMGQFDKAYSYLSQLDLTGSFEVKKVTVLARPSGSYTNKWTKVADICLG
jgi:2'-5' RNA ligase